MAVTSTPPSGARGAAKPAKGGGCAIGIKDVRDAAARISGHAVRTPVVELRLRPRGGADAGPSARSSSVLLKCENLQRGGSFKVRGACHSVVALKEAAADGGRLNVVTHSSGNHAAALALAASMNGADAHVIMPETAPQCKKDLALRNGASTLTLCAATMEAREAAAAEVMASTGATMVPPYNHPLTMAGQGTVGLELMDQVDGLECIVVPVSGAGLISGIAVAAKSINPAVRVVAAEPAGTNDAADIFASFSAGALQEPGPPPDTIADGLRARMGDLTWPVVRGYVDAVIPVTEDEIRDAMAVVWTEAKLVCEPSGAVPLAAFRSARFAEWAEGAFGAGAAPKTALIVSGGNLDLNDKWSHIVP